MQQQPNNSQFPLPPDYEQLLLLQRRGLGGLIYPRQPMPQQQQVPMPVMGSPYGIPMMGGMYGR